MWLIHKPPNTMDENRKLFAQTILQVPDSAIGDFSTIKFKHVFRRCLIEAANTGTVHERVYELVWQLAQTWFTDTQEIEGTNGVLKHMLAISPSLGWSLLSSRVTIRKMVAKLNTKDARRDFIDFCTEYHHLALEYSKESSRFSEVDADTYPFTPHPLPPPLASTTAPCPDRLCCAKLVAMCRKKLQQTLALKLEPSTTTVFRFESCIDGTRNSVVLVPSLMHYTKPWVSAAELLVPEDPEEDTIVQLRFPIESRHFVEALLQPHLEVYSSALLHPETSDMFCSALTLIWDRHSFNSAKVISETPLFKISEVCRSGNA
jgi:hypothetical protein